jgi:two-component system phosphate regulon sensor histidine kinase PhoR
VNKIWITERLTLLVALLVVIFLTALTNAWVPSALLTLVGYIGWLYYRLIRLEQWLSRGTKVSEVFDDNGFIGIIVRHLYRQKKHNNERKKRTKDILGRLNRNIAALPDATVLLNQYREIEWCNEPAQYLLAIHGRNDLGQRITNLIRHPDFSSYLDAPEARPYLEVRAPGDSGLTIQIRVVRFGGEQTLLIARNISDQALLQEGLKNFVANASHELKSPLTVISGHLEMLEDEKELTTSGQKSLKTVQRQTNKMIDLVEDLLLLSQVESYHLQADEGEPIDCLALTKNIIAMLDVGLNQGRIEPMADEQYWLLGVKAEVEGMCINLIENALKYSPQKTSVSVSWSLNRQGELLFSVIDCGTGISANDLPHITERYYRGSFTGEESSTVGSGLGLSIVQQAATKHGATLMIDSEQEVGSRFTINFPSYRLLKEPEKATVINFVDDQSQ